MDHADELRVLRARAEGLSAAIGRAEGRRHGLGSARFVGKVVNLGHMGSSAGLFYAVNPVEVTGNEAEGGNAALAVDTSRVVLVRVVGQAPAVGDLLLCMGVDYRWEAEKRVHSSTVSQPGCACNPMPGTMQFAGNYTTIFGPPGRDPTSLGCPTTAVLTAQARPSGFQAPSIVANNTVWMNARFTFQYYTFNPNTGNFDILNTTSGARIIYWCQPQNGHITLQIYDEDNSYGGVNALLAQTGDSNTVHLGCTPFLWQYNAATTTWLGRTQLNA